MQTFPVSSPVNLGWYETKLAHVLSRGRDVGVASIFDKNSKLLHLNRQFIIWLIPLRS